MLAAGGVGGELVERCLEIPASLHSAIHGVDVDYPFYKFRESSTGSWNWQFLNNSITFAKKKPELAQDKHEKMGSQDKLILYTNHRCPCKSATSLMLAVT